MLQVQVDQSGWPEGDAGAGHDGDRGRAGRRPAAVLNGHFIGRGGWVEGSAQRLGIRHVQPIVSHEDLANLPIVTKDGRKIRLSDVADLARDHQPLTGDAVINQGDGLDAHRREAALGQHPGRDQGVEAALNELRPGLPGIAIDSEIFRPATFIEDAIDNLTKALILGALLMIVMLALFLYLAHRADQRRRHPAVAAVGGAGAERPRSHHQHDGPGRVRDRPRGHRRRRHHRHRERRPAAAAAPSGGRQPVHRQSSSTPRSRCAGPSSTPPSSRSSPSCRSSCSPACPGPSSALALAYALALGLDGRRPDGHAGAQPDLLPQPQVPRAPGVPAGPPMKRGYGCWPGSSTGRAAPTPPWP